MRAFLAICLIRVKGLFQYRTAALAGVFTQLFWGLLHVMIFWAFYKHASQKQPLSLEQTVTFIWIGQALFALLPWNLDKEIEGEVKRGDVAYALMRPLPFYSFCYARSLAMRLAPTAMRSLPIFAIGGFLGLSPPASLASGGVFLLSVFFALLLSASITTLVLISLFWTLCGQGIQRLLPHLSGLLSGILVPLPLFPNWAQPILALQPFRGVLDIPCRLYTGVIPLSDASLYLVFQIGWTLFFVILGQKLMQKALKQFVIQGG